MEYREIIQELEKMADPKAVAGMAKYGIRPRYILGVSVSCLRVFVRKIQKDHGLAAELWASGIHEARLLACLIDEPVEVTESQMEEWAASFDSWDICDQCCTNLFRKSRFAFLKAFEWSGREEEYVKRAAFTLMAQLAVHDKTAADSDFKKFLKLIEKEAGDGRNYVKKAVNWGLRQIGKRNLFLNEKSLETAGRIQKLDSRSAKWIAADAIRELTSEAVQQKLVAKANRIGRGNTSAILETAKRLERGGSTKPLMLSHKQGL